VGDLTLDVRPFDSPADYERMIEYFHSANEALLAVMGVDRRRLPAREAWLERLLPDLERPASHKQTYYLSWRANDVPVGHSNVNQISFGQQAFVHMHLWRASQRRGGMGQKFFDRSLRLFISALSLERVICEPHAQNTAPNRVLQRAGFRLVRCYRTTPGLINSEQDVNRWELDVGSAHRAGSAP
jgi:RimJ/RimL family protein N-acetyltransferase